MTTVDKERDLIAYLRGFERLALAYSGGVDSAYLADVCHEVLGTDCQMIIADSPSIPRSELSAATALAEERGWNLRVIKTSEHTQEGYLQNRGDRCYYCKKELFAQMDAVMQSIAATTLAHGAIEDDRFEIRHGAKAAAEYSVVAPLQEARLYKSEIRELSALRKLPTSDKASFACLGSRFPSGTRIDIESMSQVERAEEILRSGGFNQYRVRHHGDLCRIEIELGDFEKIIAAREEIVAAIKATGYRHVALDLDGYRTGSTA